MSPEERDARILSLAKRVSVIANVALSKLKWTERVKLHDDVHQAAWVGAIRAVDAFDDSRGVQLGTYAQFRIEGTVLDCLREVDTVSRRHRWQIEHGLRGAPVEVGPPTPNTLRGWDPQFHQIELRQYVRALMNASKFTHKQRASLGRFMKNGIRPKDFSWMLAKLRREVDKVDKITKKRSSGVD